MTIRAVGQRIERFFFLPESDVWISVLRVGLAVELISFCLALRKDWAHLLSAEGGGFIHRDLMEAALNADSSFIPRVDWLIQIGIKAGISEPAILWFIWGWLVVAALSLLAGLFSRAAAITAWFLHLSVVKSIGYFSYGVDNMTTIGLFYLMIAPLPDHLSLDTFLRARSGKGHLVSFFRRILQIHLCLIYFFGGLAKLSGIGWWNGTNVWRALTIPPFRFVDPELVLHYKGFLPVAGLAICLLEFCYPLFIWNRRTRIPWLICVCGMHLMIAFTMGMFLFAFVMIVLNLAAFMPLPSTSVRTSQEAIVAGFPTAEASGAL